MEAPIRSILIAVGFSAVVVVVSIMGIGIFLFLQHHDSEAVSAATADAEFLHLRARFADQQPMLDMRERQARAEAGASGAARPLEFLSLTRKFLLKPVHKAGNARLKGNFWPVA